MADDKYYKCVCVCVCVDISEKERMAESADSTWVLCVFVRNPNSGFVQKWKSNGHLEL